MADTKVVYKAMIETTQIGCASYHELKSYSWVFSTGFTLFLLKRVYHVTMTSPLRGYISTLYTLSEYSVGFSGNRFYFCDLYI